jgi:CBS domain-containing protein
MIKNTPVSEIMTREVISLNTSDQLERAEEIFKSRKIRHIPIVRNDKIVGMLSYNDLLRISFADAYSGVIDEVDSSVYEMFSLDQVMVKNPVSIAPTQTISELATVFTRREFHALPVVEDGRLVGIVTTTDLIRFMLGKLD